MQGGLVTQNRSEAYMLLASPEEEFLPPNSYSIEYIHDCITVRKIILLPFF